MRYLALLPLLWAVLAAGASPLTRPDTRPIEEAVSQQARMVRDVSQFDYQDIIATSDSPWMVARVSAWFRSEYPSLRMSLNGKSALPVTTQPSIHSFFEGEVEPLEVLSIKTKYPKLLFEAEALLANDSEPEIAGWLGSPFRESGGIVILRVNDDFAGFDRFRPTIMIPPEWQKYVKPALSFYKEGGAFATGNAKRKSADLEKLASDENPFVAVAAFRMLVDMDRTSAQKLVDRLSTNSIVQGAEALYLIRGTNEQRSLAQSLLAKKVASAHYFDDVYGISLAQLLVDDTDLVHKPDSEKVTSTFSRTLKR